MDNLINGINNWTEIMQTITSEQMYCIIQTYMYTWAVIIIWELLDYAQYYICHKRYHDKKVRQLLEQIERNQGNEKV